MVCLCTGRNMERNNEAIEDLELIRSISHSGGHPHDVERLRQTGRLTARERIKKLLDPDSFIEFEAFITHRNPDFNLHVHQHPGDGVVAGHGTLNGRPVHCFAQDFGVFGGSMGEMHAAKITRTIEMAERSRTPIIGMWDGGGQRAHDGVTSLAETGVLMDHLVQCSGRIPIFSLILGPVVGASALCAGIADFTIMSSQHGQLFLSSPLVTPEIISGEQTPKEVGDAQVHSSRSGIACLVAEDEDDAIEMASELLGFLPDHCLADPPFAYSGDERDLLPELNELIPDNPNKPYDMRKVIKPIVDDEYFVELFEQYAENILIGFARIGGFPVGIIANQPKVLAGCLDIDASIKAARFIRTCDAFNIPLVTFEDVPGFLPGVVQEWGGIIRHGAKLLYAYAEATVPKLTIVTRKAYGGAYLAMSCKHLRSDLNIAWPTAELAVMGAEGAVNIIHRREIGEAKDEDKESVRLELVERYKQKFGDPYVAARNGWLDDVIEPELTRKRIIDSLELLSSKQEWSPSKKHGNIPL